MIELIKKNTVIITALLMFFAALKLKLYYDGFGISILQYVNFSEILITLLNDIFIFLKVVFVIYFQSIVVYTAMILFDLKAKTNWVDRYKEVTSKPENFAIPLFLVSITLFGLLYFNKLPYNKWTMFFLVLNVAQFLAYFFKILNDNPKSEKLENTRVVSENAENIITLIICFLVFIYSNSQHEIEKTKNQNKIVKIIGSDTLVCSKQTHLHFVGKTENFVFVWNDSSNTSTIMPQQNLKYIMH